MSRSRFATAISGIAVILVLTACGRTSPEEGFDERSVDGVRERVYLSAKAPRVDPYELEPGAVFGEDQGQESYLFSRPTVMGISSDGTVYILDVRMSSVSMFTAGGRYLRSFGRQGQGPGEFSGGGIVGYVLDSRLMIYDVHARRTSFFNLMGELQEDLPLSFLTPFSIPIPYQDPAGMKMLVMDSGGTIGQDYQAYRLRAFLIDGEFRPAGTLIDTMFRREVFSVGPRTVTPPYTSFGAIYAAGPDRPLAWWYPGEYRLEFMDPWEGGRRAVTIPLEPRPVTAELKERRIEAFARSGLEDEARRNLRFPIHLPFISSMKWGADARLWVLDYEAYPEEADSFGYNVFGEDGSWLFSQELPYRPIFFTGEGVYVEREEGDGTPLIDFYRFVERGGG